ncbi:MAG: glycosyltransferase family 4 protein [Pseudomonadota bacterium]
MPRSKLIHLVSSLQTGGAEKFVTNLAKYQQEQGYDVGVFSYGEESDELVGQLASHGIQVMLPTGPLRSRLSQARLFTSGSVLHIHSPAVIRALAPVSPLLIGTRVVYTIHGEVDPEQKFLGATHWLAKLYLSKVTAVSEAARDSVRGRYRWDAKHVDVVPNGILMPEQTLPVVQDTVRLGCVSRLVSLKNIPLLFEAVQKLSLKEQLKIQIAVIGDGPEMGTISSASKLVKGAKVTMTGQLNDEIDIYSRFDFLVNCSDTEGLPMSIIEAMSHGRAVIATSVGAVPKLVINKKTGWLFPPGDSSALADILSMLVSDTQECLRLGSTAHEHVRRHYGIDSVSATFDSLYSDRTS